MKREDIIAMAREAGCHHSYRYTGTSHKRSVYRFHNTELERFAQLVAAAEREVCAELCVKLAVGGGFAADCAAAIRARSKT